MDDAGLCHQLLRCSEAIEVKMSYGLPVSTLSMMAPAQLHNLMNLRRDECSVLEMLGGGYYYIDTYSQNNNRNDNLKIAAERLALSMRRYHVGLLGVMAMDVKSAASREAYQAFVDANDRLEGNHSSTIFSLCRRRGRSLLGNE